MQRATILIAILASLGIAPADAQTARPDGMTPAIEQCIRSNAAKVEAAEPDLTKATDFLVSYECALPIVQERNRINRIQQEALAARTKQQCEDRVAQQKKMDPSNTNRTYENCDQIGALFTNLTGMDSLSTYGPVPKPVAAIDLAAHLLIDLRLSHIKTRQ